MGEPLETGSPRTAEFTVLLPVYRGDRAEFVAAAYRSVTTEQTLPPTFVVIVQDGPVGEELATLLGALAGNPGTTLVPLPENRGLSIALNVGLGLITTEIVARADADDICLPERFATQVPIIAAGADLVGSAIVEFESDPAERGEVRNVEIDPARIALQARWKSPFNHPSVVYRRSAVLAVGGYREMPQIEDYLLWAAMLQAGAVVANCPEALVCYRIGAGAYGRRGGRQLFRSELALQREFRRIGFTTRAQWLRNVVLRGAYRLVPQWLRQSAYRWHLNRKPAPHPDASRG